MKKFQRPAWLVRLLLVVGPIAPVPLATACRDAAAPLPPATAELLVPADPVAYVRLGSPSQPVSVTDPAGSTAWDLAFASTSITANGGAAGPGAVSVYCICQNARAIAPEVHAMTPESQRAPFEAVSAADVPPPAAFVAPTLTPAISGWYAGHPGPGISAVPTRGWILREGVSPNVTLGKFRVTNVAGATSTAAGVVTFEYAFQPWPGAPFGATRTAAVDTRHGPVAFDFAFGATTIADDWDLRFSGFEIRMNSGASGPGSLAAVADNSTPFGQLTAARAASAPAPAFRRDAFTSVFASSPWYRFNITGFDNRVWPTFNVYLVRRGSEVYKVQLTGYYDPSGSPRQITLRSARLR